jgi:hypothetical protein
MPCAAPASDIAWVWHSSDAPARTGEIALLLDHLVISGQAIHIRQRRRVLVVEKSTRVTPVVHVQTDIKHPSHLDANHTKAIVKAVKAASQSSTSGWVQLDFEARQSEQAYYLNLVNALRDELPPTIKLSVTVMASWCMQTRLLEKIRADEIVPMFFRMGVVSDTYWARLQNHPERLSSRCKNTAAGFAVQETTPTAILSSFERRYWFNYNNWK